MNMQRHSSCIVTENIASIVSSIERPAKQLFRCTLLLTNVPSWSSTLAYCPFIFLFKTIAHKKRRRGRVNTNLFSSCFSFLTDLSNEALRAVRFSAQTKKPNEVFHSKLSPFHQSESFTWNKTGSYKKWIHLKWFRNYKRLQHK